MDKHYFINCYGRKLAEVIANDPMSAIKKFFHQTGWSVDEINKGIKDQFVLNRYQVTEVGKENKTIRLTKIDNAKVADFIDKVDSNQRQFNI